MLRLIVLLLVLANAAFYAWRQGMLDGVVGTPAQGDREPGRLSRQVRPDTIQVMPPSAALAVADAPPTCLEAGPYNAAQIGAAETALQAVLPPGSWVNQRTEAPAVYAVYMGKFATRDALQRKADELRRLRVPFDEVRTPPELEGGLALTGRYDNRAAAERALADASQRGVRTARVAAVAPPAVMHTLRIERADATLQSRLATLRAEALLGKPFALCAPAARP